MINEEDEVDVRAQLPEQLSDRLTITVFSELAMVLAIERSPGHRCHWFNLNKDGQIPDNILAYLCVVVR